MDEQQYWDKQHDKYATTEWIEEPSIFAEWVTQYLPDSGKLLDLGAGQAQDSRFFDNCGFEVTATDFSEHALELARPKSAHLTYKVVDLSEPLSFEDDQFDVVYAHLALHYFDATTTEKLFAEILRVLKPGGTLAALCNADQDPEISEGEEIEPNFIRIDGIQKRYFNPEIAKEFANEFQIIVSDAKGTTYKDEVKGVHNLVRLIARKPA